MQRYLEELQQHILVLEQEPHGPEEPSISDSEPISDGEDEYYGTVGPSLAVRPIVQQKVTYEQLMAPGGHPQWAPNVTGFTAYILRWSWLLGYAISAKSR